MRERKLRREANKWRKTERIRVRESGRRGSKSCHSPTARIKKSQKADSLPGVEGGQEGESMKENE